MVRIHCTCVCECLAAVGSRQLRLLIVLLGICVSAASTRAAIIDTDFTIDAAHSFPSEGVTITDGVGGPPTVTMVPGGTVRGFTVAGNSTFEMTGGTSTFLSGAQDNATLIVRGGTIECSAPACLLIDYDALVHIEGNSSIHLFGGNFLGFVLVDNGSAHYYGNNFIVTPFPTGALVQGEFADGQPIYSAVTIPFGVDPSSRIFLHEIPEPGTGSLAAASFFSLALLRSRNRLTRL